MSAPFTPRFCIVLLLGFAAAIMFAMAICPNFRTKNAHYSASWTFRLLFLANAYLAICAAGMVNGGQP